MLLFPCWHRAQGRPKPFPWRSTQGSSPAGKPSPFSPRPPRLAGFPPLHHPGWAPAAPCAAPRPVLTARCRRLTPPSRGRPEERGRGRPGGGGRPAGPTRPAGCPGALPALLLRLRERGRGERPLLRRVRQPRAAGAAPARGRCACARGRSEPECAGFAFRKWVLCLWVLVMSRAWSAQPAAEEDEGETSALLAASSRGAAPMSSLSRAVTGPEGMA